MRLVIGTIAAGILFVAVGMATASEAVRWAGDYRQACDVAAEQRRLVLLHFYSDNCPPCVWMDRNVFTQAEVGQALDRYYVPVKVHVGQSPELARKYNVQSWPTDIVITPAGMELYRTSGRKSSAEYLAIVEQVALHGGARAATAGQTPVGAAAPSQNGGYPSPYQGGPIAGNYQSQLPQTDRNTYQSSIGPATHENLEQTRTPFGTQPGQQTAEAPNVAPVGNPMGPMAPANPMQGVAGGMPYGSAPQQPAAPNYGDANATGGSPYFQPRNDVAAAPPAGPNGGVYQPQPQQQSQPEMQQPAPYGAPAMAQQQAPYGQVPNAPASYAAAPQQAPAMQPPQQPIVNRYTQSAPPVAANTSPAAAQPGATNWQSPPPQAPAAAPQPSNAPYSMQPQFAGAPQQPAAPQMVPSAEAPPVVLDGCCAVSMIEQKRLKKADPRFGAVHRGRTYLFVSEEEQKKFLADPDRYAVVLSGYDTVRFSKTGELVEGKRQYGMMFQQKIYLFADEEGLNQFSASPQFYSTAAHQAMLRSETGGPQLR